MQFLVNIWNAQRNAADVSYLRDAHSQAVSALSNQTAENAALRSQINQRGAGGRFAPKQPK